MPQLKKKGQAGQAKNFMTRTQAVKKLQLSLPDFRKLCIWKGIYPREPRDKRKVAKSATASTTFYYTKDIQFLLHEPLLRKFREQKVLEKKIARALGRGDVADAARFERHAARPETTGKPRYTLDHVVRERYPTFADALRDLDDCLSMLFLFAHLPATSAVPARMIARCERLCLEFQHYLIVSRSLRKSFLSIKGIYYQARIQGEDVLWVVPYKFNQRVVGDVDFRIMGTFVEFYMTLLGFVNFRLYTSIGLKYPPQFDQRKDEKAAELGAFTLEGTNPVAGGPDERRPQLLAEGGATGTESASSLPGPDPKVQAEVNKVIRELKQDESAETAASRDVTVSEDAAADDAEEERPTETIDKFEPAAPGGDILPQPSSGGHDPSTLFAHCTFFLSREVPRQPIEFLLRAFGCKRIGWDAVLGDGAFTHNELDPSITHQIVDRPLAPAAGGEGDDNQTSQRLGPNRRVPGRIYVQPQWVWDSVNDEELKRPDLYAPGAQLPPHLSPFVRNVQGQYDPTVPLEEQETEAEALEASLAQNGDGEAGADEDREDGGAERDHGMDVARSEEDEEEDEEDADGRGSFDGFSEGEDGEENEDDENDDDDDGGEEVEQASESESEASEAVQRQLELEAELAGRPAPSQKNKKIGAAARGDAQVQAKREAKKALQRRAREEAEELERAKGMLSKKKRKLFEQMMYTNSKKSAEDLKLRAKRRKIEQEKAAKAKAK